MRLVYYKIRQKTGPSTAKGTPEVYSEHNITVATGSNTYARIKQRIKAEMENHHNPIPDEDIIICNIMTV